MVASMQSSFLLTALWRHSAQPEDARYSHCLDRRDDCASYATFVAAENAKRKWIDYIVSGGGARNHTLMAMLTHGSSQWDAS